MTRGFHRRLRTGPGRAATRLALGELSAHWLVTTEAHRVEILRRLLAAPCNGQVTWAGDRDSPDSIRIALSADDAGVITQRFGVEATS